MKLRVKIGETFYEVEVEDINTRPVIARVNGEAFEVYPEESTPQPAPAAFEPAPQASTVPRPPQPVVVAPKAAPVSAGGNAVTAPIPGVILSISVKIGDEVASGQELCILEAMKMNNAIRANRAGKISAIHVTPGDHVAHNQLLMEFAE